MGWKDFRGVVEVPVPGPELDLALIGLQNAGKTSFARVLACGAGDDGDAPRPTVGFETSVVRRRRLRLRCVDMGGSARFRALWERHCEDAHVIVWVIDSADAAGAVEARDALRETLTSEGLAGSRSWCWATRATCRGAGIPQLVDALGLRDIAGREVRCFSISCKLGTNVDAVLRWLKAREEAATGARTASGLSACSHTCEYEKSTLRCLSITHSCAARRGRTRVEPLVGPRARRLYRLRRPVRGGWRAPAGSGPPVITSPRRGVVETSHPSRTLSVGRPADSLRLPTLGSNAVLQRTPARADEDVGLGRALARSSPWTRRRCRRRMAGVDPGDGELPSQAANDADGSAARAPSSPPREPPRSAGTGEWIVRLPAPALVDQQFDFAQRILAEERRATSPRCCNITIESRNSAVADLRLPARSHRPANTTPVHPASTSR